MGGLYILIFEYFGISLKLSEYLKTSRWVEISAGGAGLEQHGFAHLDCPFDRFGYLLGFENIFFEQTDFFERVNLLLDGQIINSIFCLKTNTFM